MSGNGTSNEALQSITSQISTYQQLLQERFNEIPILKQRNDQDMVKYGVIAFVTLFFTMIIIDNTWKTLRVYWRNRTREAEYERSTVVPDENEYEGNNETPYNYRSELRRNIQRANNKQNKALHVAKREKLASTDKEFNEKDVQEKRLESDLTLQSLDKNYDDYTYNKNKKEEGFWDMIFKSEPE